MDTAGVVLIVLFFVVVSAAVVGGVVFWILKIVEVARIPGYQFQAAGTDQLPWVLVVVLAGIIGALIWHFAKRKDVLAAAGWLPSAPPGWYPEPGGYALRWWDGARWTEHRHPPPGSA